MVGNKAFGLRCLLRAFAVYYEVCLASLVLLRELHKPAGIASEESEESGKSGKPREPWGGLVTRNSNAREKCLRAGACWWTESETINAPDCMVAKETPLKCGLLFAA